MRKLNQQGGAGVMIALIITVALLLGALGFGMWSFSEQQKYKNDVDAIVAKEVKIAVDKNSTAKDNEFAEKQKSPVTTYNGPSSYGSVVLKYPKSWSAYVDSGSNSEPINAYFHPNVVPGLESKSAYALRLQVTNSSYDEELQQFDSFVENGEAKVVPYAFPSVSREVGVKVTGKIDGDKQGTLILVPMRDKALKLWTETDQYVGDLNTYVLPNFKFTP